MSITNCDCMKINTAQIVRDCSFVQYFSMCCPFSAITNRTGDRNPSMALSSWSLIFQSYYHLKTDLLTFRTCYVIMSIERPILKKSYFTDKKTFERTL